MDAIRFLVNSILWLVFFVYLMRVVLQFARADFRNPIAQFVVRVTNPLVLPLRRVVPPIGRVDFASIVALFVVELAMYWIALWMAGVGTPEPGRLLLGALFDLVRNVLQFYLVALFIHVVLSWVAPQTYSPAAAILEAICEPLLRPVRRLLPPIGGLDLSVLVVLLLLGVLLRLMPPV
jgi:YggT family protein